MYWRECALGGGNVRFLRKSGGFVKPLYIYIYACMRVRSAVCRFTFWEAKVGRMDPSLEVFMTLINVCVYIYI